MTDELPEIHNHHPYLMYKMIKETPNALRKTLTAVDNVDISFKRGCLTVTGNGTSFHAGMLGFQGIEGQNSKWNGIQSYELEKYRDPFPNILAISHTGKTHSTIQSILKNPESNSIGITHDKDSPMAEAVDIPIIIPEKDTSLCNTKAFFDNVLASAIVSRKFSAESYNFNGLVNTVSDSLSEADGIMKSIVEELPDIHNIFVLGAGNNYYAARESAQKLKEATHIHSEGIEMEEYNHGCTSVTDKSTLILIISNGEDKERVKQISDGIRYVNATSVVIGGEGDFSVEVDYKNNFELPIQAMAYTYLLAYYMAVKMHINPDILRLDEKSYYDFDMAIFPPGHH